MSKSLCFEVFISRSTTALQGLFSRLWRCQILNIKKVFEIFHRIHSFPYVYMHLDIVLYPGNMEQLFLRTDTEFLEHQTKTTEKLQLEARVGALSEDLWKLCVPTHRKSGPNEVLERWLSFFMPTNGKMSEEQRKKSAIRKSLRSLVLSNGGCIYFNVTRQYLTALRSHCAVCLRIKWKQKHHRYLSVAKRKMHRPLKACKSSITVSLLFGFLVDEYLRPTVVHE